MKKSKSNKIIKTVLLFTMQKVKQSQFPCDKKRFLG